MILGFRSAFPDLKLEVHDIFGAGDKVVSRWTITGTHRGPFLGVAPTSNRISIAESPSISSMPAYALTVGLSSTSC